MASNLQCWHVTACLTSSSTMHAVAHACNNMCALQGPKLPRSQLGFYTLFRHNCMWCWLLICIRPLQVSVFSRCTQESALVAQAVPHIIYVAFEISGLRLTTLLFENGLRTNGSDPKFWYTGTSLQAWKSCTGLQQRNTLVHSIAKILSQISEAQAHP